MRAYHARQHVSNDSHPSERVVIVGAGIAGCHAAFDLATDHDVTVLEANEVAGGATGLAAGIVAPTMFYSDATDVAQHANAFFRDFDGTDGFSFTRRHRVDFVSADDVSEALSTAERLSEAGFDVQHLDPSAVTDRFPRFRSNTEFDTGGGAILYGDTGWVDPYQYANALKSAAEARGATFERGIDVTDVRTENGRVTGVETSAGRYDADAVLLAAGWRTRTLLPAESSIPVRPYRTQCVVLEPEKQLDDRFPIGRLAGEHLYFRPEHGGLLVGGAHETVSDPTTVSRDADESFKHQVADVVPRLVEGFDDAGFRTGWAGVDAATPDTRPIIDHPSGAPEGLLVATGFNGLGIMTSPVVGPTVRQHLGGENAPFSTAPFAADRFDVSGSDFAYTSTSEL